MVYLYLWLYRPLLELGRFFSLLILYTVGRTPWTGDQPVARPLPICVHEIIIISFIIIMTIVNSTIITAMIIIIITVIIIILDTDVFEL
jgi:hypothetical protein